MQSRIMVDPLICHGKPVIKNTRVIVADVLDLLEAGKTFDEIIKNYFPIITREDIAACIHFANEMIQTEDIHIVNAEA
ncbi:MAG: DUF433 domain-containing protein [Ignavibacteriales bacterium]|nr:DUF433 domain-containing protein [Ignavibacteriales bacterium]